ncbi:MAG: DNA/RNA nuclease SfsA [Cuniculiplasma sp.]
MKVKDLAIGHEIMKITPESTDAIVVERINRFLVDVNLDGEIVHVHLHDPGRLRELIYPGSKVRIRRTEGKKTAFSITSCVMNGEEILLDTRFHNKIAESLLDVQFRREVTHGDSRYDFATENGFLEVKGCSMKVQNYVIFPDAPTVRGVKHLSNLTRMKGEGMDTGIMFLIFRKDAQYFYPNGMTDPDFRDAFLNARAKGVRFYFPKFSLKRDTIFFDGYVSQGKDPFKEHGFVKEVEKYR